MCDLQEVKMPKAVKSQELNLYLGKIRWEREKEREMDREIFVTCVWLFNQCSMLTFSVCDRFWWPPMTLELDCMTSEIWPWPVNTRDAPTIAARSKPALGNDRNQNNIVFFIPLK